MHNWIIQPMVWLALGIAILVGGYAAFRLWSRAVYKSRAEYESEKKSKEES